MPSSDLAVRDIRSLPFIWIQKALFDLKLTWKAIITYSALAYYAQGASCKHIEIKKLAYRVNVSEDTIKRGLKELCLKKAIRVQPRFRIVKQDNAVREKGKRQQLPNEYVLIDLAANDATVKI